MRHCFRSWLAVFFLIALIGLHMPVYAESSAKMLTFEQAVQKALAANPEITAFKGEIRQAKARRHQAGLFPNPELAFELEGFGGSGPFSGMENAERTVSLEQKILLGGKINKRRVVASEQLKNIEWEMQSLEQDIRKMVAHAFIEVLSVQNVIDLQQNIVGLSEQVHETVKHKADAGKVSPVEAIKAEIELKNNRQALQSLNRRLEQSRKNLAALWGSSVPDFAAAAGSLDDLPDLPEPGFLKAALLENPDIKRFDAEGKYQKAVFESARTERIPDLTVSGGYRRVPETDDDAFIFEISVPLKIFDRNQGNIEAVREAVNQVGDRQTAAVNTRRQQLNAAFHEALALRDEINALKYEIIPAMRKVFSASQEGYQSGKYTYLELLDAQRTLFESQKRCNDAMADYHLAVADIERLIGQSLDQADSHEPTIENKGLQQEAQHNG